MVKIGEPVPDFEFPMFYKGNAHNNVTRLAKHLKNGQKKQWVVLFFYPGDATFVCATELQDLANAYGQFKERNCEIIAISTDSPETHRIWQERAEATAVKDITFPWGSDMTHEMMNYFNINDGKGRAQRGTFIIDTDGVCRKILVHDDGMGRSVEELLNSLDKAQFAVSNSDMVCPATWTRDKGKQGALKPGDKLIGNI